MYEHQRKQKPTKGGVRDGSAIKRKMRKFGRKSRKRQKGQQQKQIKGLYHGKQIEKLGIVKNGRERKDI